MNTYKIWSQRFFPKVFGVVFFIYGQAFASEYKDATKATTKAFLIQSGIRDKINRVKSEQVKAVKTIATEYNFERELVLVGVTVQALKDKSVLFQHNGFNFMVYPNQIQVRFNF